MKALALFLLAAASLPAKEHPLFRDFVGLDGHSVAFKPKLYSPVCRWVRDYHPVPWDLEGDTSKLPAWPEARNRVSWAQEYGSWHTAGLRISACLQIDDMKDKWKDLDKDSAAYAGSFASQFGPGGAWPFVETIEIGNEPGLYDDATYGRMFDAMAGGIRKADPKIKIVTCNVEAGKSDRYWKGADLFKDRSALYDVLQIHRYAISEQWPVWHRTYPENPAVPYLSSVQKLLDWRDANAPGKEVWVTEFGWDSSTQKPDPKGQWAKWLGSTDEEQARWLVRSYFLFAGMGVEKAFAYYFNDEDKPQLHACSGLTRHYQPKPAYHAVAWMLKNMADHRFSRVVQASLTDGYIYEFAPEKADAPFLWAVWHPTKEDATVALPSSGLHLLKAERMPLKEGAAEALALGDNTKIQAGERPCLVWCKPE